MFFTFHMGLIEVTGGGGGGGGGGEREWGGMRKYLVKLGRGGVIYTW